MELKTIEKKWIEALQSRYACKRFDPNQKLSPEQIDLLVESVRLTATSYGLQLMKLVLVENEELKEQLVAYSFGQEQVKDASHLFVLCREKNLTPNHFEAHIQDISNTREIPVEELEQRKNYLSDSILSKNNIDQQVWMEKQIYIALGNLLSACAIMGIDSCPMEGFIPKEYDRILDLESHNLTSVLAIPVGYRSAEDTYALQKKVRRSTDNFLVKI